MILPVVRTRKIWFTLSATLILTGIVFIALGGLRLGTDFTGGSLIQVRIPSSPPANEVLAAAQSVGDLASHVQAAGSSSFVVRSRQLSPDEHDRLLSALKDRFRDVEEESFSDVGPVLGRELRQKAVAAVILVLIGIILYVSWAFRKSSGRLSGWAFGVNAIIALIHDVLITVGVFAFLGYVFQVEVDVLFVTALLTVLGFSVHDTIVVFDRIREGLRRFGDTDLPTVIDRSVNETLIRSINTSLTTLLVLSALFFFGGSTIHYFVLALIVGITIGTYSSIFLASPLLLYWKKR